MDLLLEETAPKKTKRKGLLALKGVGLSSKGKGSPGPVVGQNLFAEAPEKPKPAKTKQLSTSHSVEFAESLESFLEEHPEIQEYVLLAPVTDSELTPDQVKAKITQSANAHLDYLGGFQVRIVEFLEKTDNRKTEVLQEFKKQRLPPGDVFQIGKWYCLKYDLSLEICDFLKTRALKFQKKVRRLTDLLTMVLNDPQKIEVRFDDGPAIWQIVHAAVEHHADLIGLSGLITPSLDEMIHVVSELERRGLNIPVLVGGAATSKLHTALKIQPAYPGPVVYTRDASALVPVVGALMNPEKRGPFLDRLRAEYAELTDAVEHRGEELVPIGEARKRAVRHPWKNEPPAEPGIHAFRLTVKEMEPWIDWDGFTRSWDLPSGDQHTRDLIREAGELLAASRMYAECVCGIFPAESRGDAIRIRKGNDTQWILFPTLRQQGAKSEWASLADFVSEEHSGTPDWIGALAVAVHGAEEEARAFTDSGDDYSALLLKSLANRLAEAAAEIVHARIRQIYWGYESAPHPSIAEMLKNRYRGIRPAPGYPTLPDHTLKQEIFDLLGARTACKMELTENFMMIPQSSVCALVLANPEARCFAVGKIAEDQFAEYAGLRPFPAEKLRQWIS